MKKAILLLITHAAVGFFGFALGVYLLPILTAPPPPEMAQVEAMAAASQFKGEFRRDLQGSDAFHWGEGQVFVDAKAVTLRGKVAPGPDYKLYLSPKFVETKAGFLALKPQMQRVGDVKTFENFIIPVPAGIDPANYKAVIIWCEAFGQFITAASYQ
jgi:hypothetical protein